jgi:hypothetical protein
MESSYFIKFRGNGERLWTWRKIAASETFGSLKRKEVESVLSSGSGRDAAYEGDVDSQLCLYTIEIHYLSLLRMSKLSLEPNDAELVLSVLEREETRWPGTLIVCLIDRRFEFTNYLGHVTSDTGAKINQYIYDRGRGATEWVSLPLHPLLSLCQSDSSNIPFWETTFNEMCDDALLHGTIQRKVYVDGRTEAWRDEYVIIQTDKIWIANAKNWETEKQFYQVNMVPNGKATVGNGGTFTIPCAYFDEKEIAFRCKSHEIAESWVHCLNNRQSVGGSDSIIRRLERSLNDAEFDASFEYFQSLGTQHRGTEELGAAATSKVPVGFDSVLPLTRIQFANAVHTASAEIRPLHDTHITPCSISALAVSTSGSLFKSVRSGVMRCCYRVRTGGRSGIFFSGQLGNSSPTTDANNNDESSSVQSSVTSPPRSVHSYSKDSPMRAGSDTRPISSPSVDSLLLESPNSPSTPNSYSVSRFRSSGQAANMFEDFVKTQSSESTNDGTLQYVVLTEVYGIGKLLLFDPVFSCYPNVGIDLYQVKQVCSCGRSFGCCI